MENQLEAIKKHLPFGYEKIIAKEIGCSQGTVHNIFNGKSAARSSYRTKVIEVASRMMNENLEVTKKAIETAESLEKFNYGTTI